MKRYLTLATFVLTTLTAHTQQPELTLQERILIQQTAILAEQADDLDYIARQIRRATLLQNLQDRRACKELPLMPENAQ
jgi:hypothetical protein